MEAFGISFLLVALAEVGDRTQLLGLVLSVKHRKPVAVLLGILLATLANHLTAATGGMYIAELIGPHATHWAIGLGAIAFGLWILRPDEITNKEGTTSYSAGAFLDTLIWFFLVEMGDKTQIATIGLAARYGIVFVVVGSVLGLFIINIPTVLAGAALGERIPVRYFRYGAAILSVLVGIAVIAGYDFL